MSLDRTTVATMAALARIKVTEEELDSLAGELSKILTWVEQLGEVDTETVEPMTSVVAMRLWRRKDEVSEGGDRGKVLANAPATTDGFFAVPKVVE